MSKENVLKNTLILCSLLALTFFGCGGGGGGGGTTSGSSVATTPEIRLSATSLNFGTVTEGNAAASFEINIHNDGNGALDVSAITLMDTTNFQFNASGGSNPCNSASPTIGAGASCTVTVAFNPQSLFSFSSALRIQSDDSDEPVLDVTLSGQYQAISALDVKINQNERCDAAGNATTAYVSVVDQAGFPITTLTVSDFTLNEGGTDFAPTSSRFVNNTETLSVALVMDYSRSIVRLQDNVDNMERAASDFVDQLRTGDEAEIIKFASNVVVSQAYSSDKDLLKAAINDSYPTEEDTALYDAIVKAIEDTAARSGSNRKAVIVITDGIDWSVQANGPKSTNDINDVINDANDNGIPVFTVGIGSSVDETKLQTIADDTGGTLSTGDTIENLGTIYQQLASLLFVDQYVLDYVSTINDDTAGTLQVTAAYPPAGVITDTDTKDFAACP